MNALDSIDSKKSLGAICLMMVISLGTLQIQPILGGALIDQLGLHYLHAHQIATRAEEAAVRADGIVWRDYDRFMQKYVKHIGDERLTKVPADLDLKPYRDEHDFDLIKRMRKALTKRGLRKDENVATLRTAVDQYASALSVRRRDQIKQARRKTGTRRSKTTASR